MLRTKQCRLFEKADAGVTAYIVDGIDPSKLENILEISIEQFRNHKKLLTDLQDTKNKLADRKDVERAKVLRAISLAIA